jgi:hypothetical protein
MSGTIEKREGEGNQERAATRLKPGTREGEASIREIPDNMGRFLNMETA